MQRSSDLIGLYVQLVKIEQGHNSAQVLRFLTGFQQGSAVMEGKTDQLLTPGNNFLVAQRTRLRQGQLVITAIFHQVDHVFQLRLRLLGLSV